MLLPSFRDLVPANSASVIRANVEVLGFDGSIIPDYQTFRYYIKNQTALQHHFKSRLVGSLEFVDVGHNLVVDAGSNQLANLANGRSTSYFNYCGVGSSTTAVTNAQTDLQTSITRVAVTSAYTTSNVAHFDTFFDANTGTGTWNETGIFNASSGSTMLSRRVLASPFTKSTSNTAVVAWQITFTPV